MYDPSFKDMDDNKFLVVKLFVIIVYTIFILVSTVRVYSVSTVCICACL